MNDDATVPLTPSAAAAQRRQVAVPERYRLGDAIGEGGMGRVYRAHDSVLGRDVAIKVIEHELPGPDKTQQRERFVREARRGRPARAPNIVAVHDVDPSAGWLVMELVEARRCATSSPRGRWRRSGGARGRGAGAGRAGRGARGSASCTATSSRRTSSSGRGQGDARRLRRRARSPSRTSRAPARWLGTPRVHGTGAARAARGRRPDRPLRARRDAVRARDRRADDRVRAAR